jgi:precorrin-6B methylase 1
MPKEEMLYLLKQLVKDAEDAVRFAEEHFHPASICTQMCNISHKAVVISNLAGKCDESAHKR